MFEPRDLLRLDGGEVLTPSGGDVLDFWRWAFSDLRSNVVRGVLAEYLVAQALGADLTQPRLSWDNYDFIAEAGWKVEVKASAYLQSWKQHRHSRLAFSRLRGRLWDDDAVRYVGEPLVRADLFVFAVHTCKEPADYNPLSLDQWVFYPVSGAVVTNWNRDAVSLTLVAQHATPVTWGSLAASAEAVMHLARTAITTERGFS